MVESHLPAPVLADLLEHAASAPPGNFAEFGVYRGGTAQHLVKIARQRMSLLYLFDTFSGIPFQGPHDSHAVGDFSDTSYGAVRELIPDAIIIEGMFPQSVERYDIHPERFAFVHVDADQYESTIAAARFFQPLLVPGGLMIFDDYGSLEGVTRAVLDWGEPCDLTRYGRALWRKG